MNQKGFAPILIVLLIVGAIGGYFLYINYSNNRTKSITQSQVVTSPSTIPDETDNWKIFNSVKFSFKYPNNLFIKETDRDFYVLLTRENDFPSNSDLMIDARLQNNYSNYDDAINKTKKDLTDISVVNINNGLKISGKITGPAYEGKSITNALFKYGNGAISVESAGYIVNDATFDQILSTFKFTHKM